MALQIRSNLPHETENQTVVGVQCKYLFPPVCCKSLALIYCQWPVSSCQSSGQCPVDSCQYSVQWPVVSTVQWPVSFCGGDNDSRTNLPGRLVVSGLYWPSQQIGLLEFVQKVSIQLSKVFSYQKVIYQ